MELKAYQERAGRTDRNPRPAGEPAPEGPVHPDKTDVIPLLGLVGEVGSLLAEYKKLLRDGTTHRRFKDGLAEDLGDILWYVANVATKFGLSLEQIASDNLTKVENRWLAPQPPRQLPDDSYAPEQRLPRRFALSFEHQEFNGVRKLVLLNLDTGEHLGDPLTDNAAVADGYRFHDVMHLAFATHLGWSPVFRKLLRRAGLVQKRTPGKVDEVDDGGRAQVIDEAIVAAAYAYAADHNNLKGVESVDWHLLRHIQQMTAGIEVSGVTTGQWNETILRGFEVWRSLLAHDGGIVRGDLIASTLTYSPPVA